MERDAFELVEKLGFIRVPCIVVVELSKTKSLMRVDVELGC